MSSLSLALLSLVLGTAGLAAGAHLCVNNALKLADKLGISQWGVGVALVGFATGFPEILVSALAAAHGKPHIGIGNALGSNITNIGLALGIVTFIAPQHISPRMIKHELPVLIGVMAMAFMLLIDADFTRWKAVLLITTIFILIWIMVRRKEHDVTLIEQPIASSQPIWSLTLKLALSVAILYVSSEALIYGAAIIAHYLGISDLIIGLTIVAIGTSLPEIAASVAGALHNSPGIAVGNVVGSNIINILVVLAMPGLIHPTHVETALLYRDFPFMIGLTLVFYLSSIKGWLSRIEGLALIGLYIGFISALYYFNLTFV